MIISLIIYIIFSILGGAIACKVPKIDIEAPELIIDIMAFVWFIVVLCLEKNRFIQIIASILGGFLFIYILNCIDKENL